METSLTGLIVITLILLMVLTIAHTYLSTQDAVLQSWRTMEERLGERARTNLTPVGASTLLAGTSVVITLTNSGLTRLTDFDRWDVIVQYSDGVNPQLTWLPYRSGANQWSESLHTAEGGAEVYDPGILNPGEKLMVTVSLSPAVGTGTQNRAVIVTPNGICASAVFTN